MTIFLLIACLFVLILIGATLFELSKTVSSILQILRAYHERDFSPRRTD